MKELTRKGEATPSCPKTCGCGRGVASEAWTRVLMSRVSEGPPQMKRVVTETSVYYFVPLCLTPGGRNGGDGGRTERYSFSSGPNTICARSRAWRRHLPNRTRRESRLPGWGLIPLVRGRILCRKLHRLVRPRFSPSPVSPPERIKGGRCTPTGCHSLKENGDAEVIVIFCRVGERLPFGEEGSAERKTAPNTACFTHDALPRQCRPDRKAVQAVSAHVSHERAEIPLAGDTPTPHPFQPNDFGGIQINGRQRS